MLQNNYDNYSFFFDRFVPLLEKKTNFKRKIRTATKDEDLLTISSEASDCCYQKSLGQVAGYLSKSGGRVSIRGYNKKLTESPH